jgi:transcriptional regulator with GAF, ATPase, and Fis domain
VPGQILDLLIETTGLADLLGAITDLAVTAVPGCVSASITLIRDSTPATIASSDARALAVDQKQYAEGRGPCMQAARTDTVVRIDDVAAAALRHDGWAATARTAGVTATMSLPIAAGPHIAAALNLYAGADGGWPEQAQTPAEALAAYTGDAILLSERLNDPDRHSPPPGPAVIEPLPTPLRRSPNQR